MTLRLRPLLLLILSVVTLLTAAAPASADILDIGANALSCTNGVPSTLNLFSNVNAPVGANAPVDTQLRGCTGGFFARFICLFESTLGMVIATFFCHLQEAWVAPFAALLMMFMVVMSIMFLAGILEFTIKEVAVMMFKIALITAFAFNTDLALGIAFKFFLGMTQGLVKSFGSLALTPPSFGDADAQIAGLVGFSPPPGCDFSGLVGATGALLLIIALLFLLPFVAGIIITSIIAMLVFYVRAAFGYLYSLVMLTFLIASMPIFVGMALFSTTRAIFDGWVTQLFSNTLQIIITFGFLAWAAALSFDFIGDISRLLTTYEVSFSLPPFTWVIGDISLGSVCSICTPNIIDDPKYLAMSPPLQVSMIAPAPNQCKDPDALSWLDILYEEEFLFYLMTQGAALTVAAMTMDEFMKDVPNVAKQLGGSSAGMVIAGLSRGYQPGRGGNSLVAPGFTNATVNFEKGTVSAWKTGKTFDTEGKHWSVRALYHTAPMRIAAAVAHGGSDAIHGSSNLSKGQATSLERNKRVGKARAAQKCMDCKRDIKRQEITIEKLEKAKEELKAKNEETQKKIEELKEEAEAAKRNKAAQDPKIKEQEDQIVATEKSIRENDRDLTKLEEKKGNIDEKIAAVNAEKPGNKKEAQAKEARRAKLEQEQKEVAAQIAKNQENREKFHGEAKELRKEHSDATERRQQDHERKLEGMEEKQRRMDLKIAEESEKSGPRERSWELNKLLAERRALKEQITEERETGNTSVAALEYRIKKAELEENKLALAETETKLGKAHTAHSNAKTALKEADFSADEWDKKTSDSRYARGQMDVRYGRSDLDEVGHHGGLSDDFWGTREDSKYFVTRDEKKQPHAWSSIMHVGEEK